MDRDARQQQWADAIRQVVREASDEQLAGMVGPDRDFYSDDAVAAAEAELGAREAHPGTSRAHGFNTAAMALGPFWYFYNGMVGRGLVLAAILVGAALGLEPVARAVGVPPSIWVIAVVVAVALYSGAFAERDRAESRTQARAARPGSGPARPPAGADRPEPAGEAAGDREPEEAAEPDRDQPPLAVVAQVNCRAAAERTRELLKTSGIDALVTTSRAEGDGESQTRVLVSKAKVLRARSMIQSFLASPEADCSE